MQRTQTVEEYILKFPEWDDELKLLRKIMTSTELEECVKWGMPGYTIQGKNVIGIGAFKAYVGIWFHQGAFLKDEQQVLQNAQEGKTKGMRQWRFVSMKDIDKKLVRKYVLEAIENQKQGKEVQISKAKKMVMAPLLFDAIQKNKKLQIAFKNLTPGRQREYAEYINEAKRDATKRSRLDKIKPIILSGKGLNEKYQ